MAPKPLGWFPHSHCIHICTCQWMFIIISFSHLIQCLTAYIIFNIVTRTKIGKHWLHPLLKKRNMTLTFRYLGTNLLKILHVNNTCTLSTRINQSPI